MEKKEERLYPEVGVSERKPLINSVEDGAVDGHPIYPTYSASIDLHPRYEIFFVVMPLFCGYACLFALQAEVKRAYGIANNGSALSHDFGTAASLVYIGNFVFRLGHNIVFAPFQPRTRVLIAMFSMAISMAIIASVFFFMKNPSLVWVFLAYAFGGLAVGTFESNLLSTITPLGKQTKLWAILAIPSGILSITVGGFILLFYGVKPGYIYLAVCVYLLSGMILFLARFYFEPWSTTNAISVSQFFKELSEWREWLPKIKWHSLALLVDMFCVSMFSPGVMLYIFDQPYINFPWFHSRLPKDWLFVIYDAGFFLGDSISRKVFYPVRILFPLVFWVFAAVGVACALSNVSFFVPFAGFFVAFCNGSIYAQANRQIDSTVDSKYNLIAFSFWLFIGDIGSVIGSNLISYVSDDIKNLYNR